MSRPRNSSVITRIKAPATSANLGPGFDTLGLALDLKNTYTLHNSSRLGIRTVGAQSADHPHESENLTLRAFRAAFERCGLEPPPVLIEADAQIPVGRGLGSSAAGITAGLALARRYLNDSFDLECALEIATEIEGHPDNVTPALVGGLVAVTRDSSGKLVHRKIPLRRPPAVHLWVPEHTLETAHSRGLLPETVRFEDATFNLGKIAMLVTGFTTGDHRALAAGLDDRLHQPYRAAMVPGFDHARRHAAGWGALGAFLSGSGPTIGFLVPRDSDETADAIRMGMMEFGGRLVRHRIVTRGVWS